MRPIILVCAFGIIVSGCAEEEEYISRDVAIENDVAEPENNVEPADDLMDEEFETVDVEGPTGERTQMQLLPSGDAATVRGLTPYVQEAGFDCDEVTTANQLQENGSPIDIFKLECSNGNEFQATMMNGNTYFKPWTGRLFGN